MQPARARSDQQGAQDTIKTLLFNQGPYTLHCIKQTPKIEPRKKSPTWDEEFNVLSYGVYERTV